MACTGEDPNLTEGGLGKPQLTIDFPARTEPGSIHEATLTIINPGPGDMRTVVVAVTAVGLSTPILGFVPEGQDAPIVDIQPEPTAASREGVFTFGPEGDAPRLAEGASFEVIFTLRVPASAGEAANSIQVYDGENIDRAKGIRLETLVGR